MTKHILRLAASKRLRPKFLLLVALILSGLTLAPGSAQTAACPSSGGLNRFGVNEVLGWPGLYTQARLEQALGLMEQAGIGWVRVTWAWKDMQPQAGGAFDYSHLDAVAQVAAEHHVQILPILLAVPEWSSSAPESVKAQYGTSSPVDHYRPQNLQDWLHYVQNVVKHFSSFGYWEVWNEPNIADFWPPAPDPTAYLTLLKATYQTIKAANPSAKMVLGGLANAGINGDGTSYLQTLYDLGAAPYFDVVSIHVYAYPPNGITPVINAVSAARAVMDANSDQAKPLWLTEIGWSDAPNAWGAPTVSQDEIASFVTQVYSAPLPADLIFWYNFRNIFANSTEVEHNFGLVNADFSAKPAFKAYEALSMPCASP